MIIQHKSDYAKRRREAYPPIEEQLDAFWKGGQALDDMQQQIADIKTKFPKPATAEQGGKK